MVSISKLVNNGLTLASSGQIFENLAVPQQAASEQYLLLNQLFGAGPYIQHPGYSISTDIPETCELQQVQLLQRHNERMPSHGDGTTLKNLYDKLMDYNQTFNGALNFLNDYEYFVPDSDLYDLETSPSNSKGPFSGTTNSLRHGSSFRSKYNDLYNSSQPLNIFTVNSDRVHQTADYFARGFLGDHYSDSNVNFVVLTEDEDIGANSLTPKYSCPNYSDYIDNDYINGFDSSYLNDILSRLTDDNPKLDLTTGDVSNLFKYCAYETNVKGFSSFCTLFSNEEFIRNSYKNDLSRYNNYGQGNNLSRWAASELLNASLTLLTQDSPESNNGNIWLSFTHDTDIETFHSALGIVEPENDLPNDYVPFPSPYKLTHIVPQGSRTYTEKYKCSNNETYIRYILNDSVIPMKKCNDGPGFSCKLEKFKEYIEDRLGGNSFAEACQIDDDRPTELTFYWDYKQKNYNASLSYTH